MGILAVTPTNAEVKLMDCVDNLSIFVAQDRLLRCFPKFPGQRKTRRRKSKSKVGGDVTPTVSQPRTTGPLTYAMARRL